MPHDQTDDIYACAKCIRMMRFGRKPETAKRIHDMQMPTSPIHTRFNE